jgi:hypothetical protein
MANAAEVATESGLQQPLPVLRKRRRVEGPPYSGQIQEPAEQNVVLRPSQNNLSDLTEYSAIRICAFTNSSGGIDGRPRSK